jgi:hypothetical protein
MADERADWRQSIVMYARNQKRSPAWQWTGPDIPSVKPPISGLFVADDGRIWVQLSQRAVLDRSLASSRDARTAFDSADLFRSRERWKEPRVYDVYEPTGAYVGQVEFPMNVVGPFVGRGDTVWAVTVDSLDVPTVKRFRIGWGR